LALPLEEEDEKPKIDDPAARHSQKSIRETTFRQKNTKDRSQYFRVVKHIPWAKGERSQKNQLSKLESLSPS
jgi:hypothetical protein